MLPGLMCEFVVLRVVDAPKGRLWGGTYGGDERLK